MRDHCGQAKLDPTNDPQKGPVGKTFRGCSTCPSRVFNIFCDLTPERLEEIDAMRRIYSYPAGATVFLEGDAARGIYCVCSGRLKLSATSADGRAAILKIACGGDHVGLKSVLSGKPHDVTAQTIERTDLCFLPKERFLDFLGRNSEVSLRLARKLSNELSEAYRQARDAMLKQSSDRLTELLLRLCRTHGEPVPEGILLNANLRQDELAELIGVSRRNLARLLARLRDLGIVECGRRRILIRDDGALRGRLPV